MPKIVLGTDTTVMREIALVKDRITIGRGPCNDIVLADYAISAEHAVIVTVGKDSFLEDLNSTNGTQVNGQPVKKHFLQDGDVVRLAGFRLTYGGQSGIENLPLIISTSTQSSPHDERDVAFIEVMNGPNAGKKIYLSKTITTFGLPTTQVVAIARQEKRYYLKHIKGGIGPIVNGKSVRDEATEMMNGDIIDFAGICVQFIFN